MSIPSETMPFSPDLIVEATTVCDRACNGCYAPNVVSRASAKDLQKSSPNLFLSPERLESCLKAMVSGTTRLPTTMSFRGGEPSRNPFLSGLIQIASLFSQRIFIETHGRWIIDPISGEEAENRSLIETIRKSKAVVKISFDRMHGLLPENLLTITNALDHGQAEWCVAITEPSDDEYTRSRALCSWVPNQKIIYQPKAASLSSLIRPRLGVIHSDGSRTGGLSIRDSFLPEAASAPAWRHA